MTPQTPCIKLAGFGLTTADCQGLFDFYRQAFDCQTLAAGRRSGDDFERLMAIKSGADSLTFRLGNEAVELLRFDRLGQAYPREVFSSDLCFQHFAIVVADMRAAYQRLSSVGGWSAITTDGPQKLPASSGGVTAFKFRDPDGHPLELLEFAGDEIPAHWKAPAKSGLFLGIDHSAISVSDSAQSISFYESLGLKTSMRSFNQGSEQARLDAMVDVQVEVTELRSAQAAPHLELLCYRSAQNRDQADLRSNDIAATRLVFQTHGSSVRDLECSQLLVDPDGHHVILTPAVRQPSQIEILANADMPLAPAKPESNQ